MRVVVTGGSGFLGARVLASLGGHDVLCLTRAPERLVAAPGRTNVLADLGRAGAWQEAVAAFQPEWCFHLAWEGLPDYSLDRCRANMDASLRLIDVVSRAGVKRVVVAGSCWEYGVASGAVAEERQPREPGVFASTKLALHTVLDSVARGAAFDCLWARVFFVYGAGQRPTSLIPSLRSAYLADRAPEIRQPAAVQDFVHVDDVAGALIVLASSTAPSGAYNVGSGSPTAVGEVANHVADYYHRPRPFASIPDAQGFWADATRTFRATGWKASVSIEEGVRRTLASLDGAR